MRTGSFYRICSHFFADVTDFTEIFKKEEIMRLKQTEHIHNELKILSFLDHSFIVKTDGFAQDERYLYIVMELVNGGELFTELRKAMKFKIEQAT